MVSSPLASGAPELLWPAGRDRTPFAMLERSVCCVPKYPSKPLEMF